MKHPQEPKDRQTITHLKDASSPLDIHLCDLARLILRYKSFPGAESIKADLQSILSNWNLTEQSLFEKTTRIHWESPPFRGDSQKDDWA